MSFKVTIKNFGKLTDATIRIGNFTVFSGSNNTGKSFVSKALYSIFGAMNANHLAVVFKEHLDELSDALKTIGRQKEVAAEPMKLMFGEVARLREIINGIPRRGDTDEIGGIEGVLPDVREQLEKIKEISAKLKAEGEKFVESFTRADGYDEDADGENVFVRMYRHEIGRMSKCVSEILLLGEKTATDFINQGLRNEIQGNLIRNFQIPNLHHLYGEEGQNIEFEIGAADDVGRVGNVQVVDGNITFQMSRAGIHQLQEHSRVLYIESPVLARLRKPLAGVDRIPPFFLFGKQEELSGVPKYFHDLENALKVSYVGNVAFPEILSRLTGGVLGGKIATGETGELFFHEEGKGKYPLHLAAMGVANLGMLALLIEKNLLDENSFLFIDEPEAHLHPAWQVEMAKALFALAEKGVNVVIATHSADILKWLEVCIKKNPKLGDIVALNHFRKNGVNANGGELMPRLNAVQKELVSPYYDLYYEGLQ